MGAFARTAALLLVLVAQGSWAGVALFQRPTDTIRLSSPTTLGTSATLEARILYAPGYKGGQDLYREWVDSVEDKHLAVTPTGFAVEFHDVGPTLSTPALVSLGAWHHVAAVYDGTSVSLYLDGMRVATEPASGSVANGASLPIFGGGVYEYPTANGFVGYVDWFRVSSVARYGGVSFSPPSAQPASDSSTVLLFHFDEAPGSTSAADQSSHHNHGTLGIGAPGATSPVFTYDPLGPPPAASGPAGIPALADSLLVWLAAALAAAGGLRLRRRKKRTCT
jgi:hypothetical protein